MCHFRTAEGRAKQKGRSESPSVKLLIPHTSLAFFIATAVSDQLTHNGSTYQSASQFGTL